MGLLQWYMKCLRMQPMRTNLATGVVLMTAGDVMAQELERHHAGGFLHAGSNPDLEGIPLERRLSLRRYGTHGGPEEEEEEEEPSGPPSVILYDGVEDTSNWHVAAHIAWDGLKHELHGLDLLRTTTMAAWSLIWTTPIMIYFYRFLDHLFPQRLPGTVLARVFLSFLFSIPNNAAFFMYGTCVHHTAEWVAVREEWREELHDFGLSESAIDDIPYDIPFDFEMMLSKAALKVSSELVETVSTSAQMWIPFNLVNFSIVPPYLRPLTLMGFSVFWNCYLSLIQHRDLALPEKTAL